MYEAIRLMPPSGERTKRYRAMSRKITSLCPWIFESQPVAYLLTHCWMDNYRPHDFGFQRWKYLTVNPDLRRQTKKSFTPLSMKDMR